MRRSTPLRRSALVQRAPERDWRDARAKVDAERVCRVCGASEHDPSGPVEAAHVIGRIHDRPREERESMLYVEPDDVVPLCRTCHRAYDLGGLDLLPYLSRDEQARAVLLVGMMAAFRRITKVRPS